MLSTKRWFRTLVIFGVIALVISFAATSRQVEWRISAVLEKARGGVPELTWGQVFDAIMIKRIANRWIVVKDRDPNRPCEVLWRTAIGDFWGRESDLNALNSLLIEQLFLRVYSGDRRARVQEGDIVLDVGGHLGTFTQLALLHGAGKVVAFEPEPTNIACFEKTFTDEIASGKVILIKAAAWDEPGELEFEIPGPGSSGEGKVRRGGTLKVTAITIDDTIESLALPRVDFIKMDIEGAERYALRGASRTIAAYGPKMALCVYHRPDDPQVIPALALEFHPNYEVIQAEDHFYFF